VSNILRTYPPEMPWAIVEVKNQIFAVATQDMREMVMMPEAAQVPNVPDHIRGVINLRGRVMPVVDLRKRMGMASALEETESFCAMMQQREQDHRNWLNELEASVKQRRAFSLTTDPHKCAFGKWYDTYLADNAWVAALLKKLDEPHRQIHGVAIGIEKLKAGQEFDKAEQLISQTRDGLLAQLVKLFTELKDLVRHAERETAVVLASSNRLFAISVDVAQSIERFPAGNIEEISPLVPISHNGVVRRLARKSKSKDVILLIETDSLMAGCDLSALPLPDSLTAMTK
jgi:chemotaxis signal transduction protein